MIWMMTGMVRRTNWKSDWGWIHGIASSCSYRNGIDFGLQHLNDEQYRLRGNYCDGRSSPIEYGFILTSLDRVSAFHTITTEDGTSTSEEFTKVVKDLEHGKSYV